MNRYKVTQTGTTIAPLECEAETLSAAAQKYAEYVSEAGNKLLRNGKDGFPAIYVEEILV